MWRGGYCTEVKIRVNVWTFARTKERCCCGRRRAVIGSSTAVHN